MNTDGGTDDDREDSDGGLVPDPYEPIIVPAGPGVLLSCGRMRTSGGDHVLGTGGNSG